MKMITAMLGGNVAYIIDQNTEEAVFGGEYSSSKTPGVTVSGIAYTAKKVKPEEINYTTYAISAVFRLQTNAYEYKRIAQKPQTLIFKEENIYEENSFQKVKLRILSVPKVYEYTIIHADASTLVLSGIYANRRGETTYYNVILNKSN